MKSDTLYVKELMEQADAAGKPVIFKDPFTCGQVQGAPQSVELAAQIAGPVKDVEEEFTFDTAGVRARGWSVQHNDDRVPGVTVAVHTEQAIAITMMLNSFPRTVGWRNAVREQAPAAIGTGLWELPQGTDVSLDEAATESAAAPPMRFELAEDVVFNSPILRKPVLGADDVRIALSNAIAVLGDREFLPPVIDGNRLLSLWSCTVSGVPIDAATVIRAGENHHVEELTVFVRPWPAFRLFRDRMIARVGHLIDESYYALSE